jgi:phosphoribosylamine---glycine ligase
MSDPVNVLLIGGGGREHALAVKLRQSPRLGDLWVTHPENPGLSRLGHPVDVPVGIREIYRLQQFCDKKQIGLVVIGPEEPLAEGYADKIAAPGRRVFGPTQAGAQIESDKAWSKALLRGASVPTADGRTFTDPEAARQFLESRVQDDDVISMFLAKATVVRDPSRRRLAIDALLRIGAASLAKQPITNADVTIVKDTGLVKPTDGTNAAILAEAVNIARAWRAKRPDLPVIKATGLAKGKGVIIPDSLAEAFDAIDTIMVKKAFGDAGRQVLIEERLEGPEVSVLAITDGTNIMVLPPCQDHKRLKDNDQGPNTGGMGAFCPSRSISDDVMAVVESEILVPTVDALRREGIDYKGVLFAGLMLTPAGPKVLEFNCRFGDPECQPLMTRLKSDLLELMLATCDGRLDQIDVKWDERAACCVVVAAEGYPERPKAGVVIEGLDAAMHVPNVTVYHAGTKRDLDSQIVTAGGRVLGVTALGDGLRQARERAYEAVAKIRFPGMQVRKDIGAKER